MSDNFDGKTYASKKEWFAEGTRIFGSEDYEAWAFKCPSCGRKQHMQEFYEFKDKGANPSSFSVECLGRYTGGANGLHKCDWAAYGFFAGPSFVIDGENKIPVFNFWEDDK